MYSGGARPKVLVKIDGKATMALTRDINEVEKIFRIMVFNILINNNDDHAKNFSFLYINGIWQVSPAYDILPSDGFNGNHMTTVNGKGKPVIADCIAVAKATSFPPKRADNIIREVSDIIRSNRLQRQQ